MKLLLIVFYTINLPNLRPNIKYAFKIQTQINI
jgi:hypothetical protein